MIGYLLGIGLALSYIGLAWNGFESEFQFLPALGTGGVILAVGLFLFPRTVGIALTPTSLLAPVAFVVAWLRLGITDALVVLLIGVGAMIGAFIIGAVHPEAADRL